MALSITFQFSYSYLCLLFVESTVIYGGGSSLLRVYYARWLLCVLLFNSSVYTQTVILNLCLYGMSSTIANFVHVT